MVFDLLNFIQAPLNTNFKFNQLWTFRINVKRLHLFNIRSNCLHKWTMTSIKNTLIKLYWILVVFNVTCDKCNFVIIENLKIFSEWIHFPHYSPLCSHIWPFAPLYMLALQPHPSSRIQPSFKVSICIFWNIALYCILM